MRFTLTALLALFVAAWSAMVLMGAWRGLIIVGAFLAFYCFLVVCRRRRNWAELVVAAFLFVLVMAFVLPPLQSASLHGGPRASCANNLKTIALALRAYHADYGSFPPACVRDAQGRPMHSWRVLILPYLEENLLYKAYRFDEPWDGPNNIKLLSPIPGIYQCTRWPSQQGDGITTCAAVVGPQTMWPDDRLMRIEDVADGADQTILIGEVGGDAGIRWTEPRDVPFENAASGLEQDPYGGGNARVTVAAMHWANAEDGAGPVALVAMADGAVRVLPADTASETLRAMLTAAGGDQVDLDTIAFEPPRPPEPLSLPAAVLTAAALLASLGFVVVSLHRLNCPACRAGRDRVE